MKARWCVIALVAIAVIAYFWGRQFSHLATVRQRGPQRAVGGQSGRVFSYQANGPPVARGQTVTPRLPASARFAWRKQRALSGVLKMTKRGALSSIKVGAAAIGANAIGALAHGPSGD